MIACIAGFVQVFRHAPGATPHTITPTAGHELETSPCLQNETILFLINEKNGAVEATKVEVEDHGDQYEWDSKWLKFEADRLAEAATARGVGARQTGRTDAPHLRPETGRSGHHSHG